MSKENAKEWVLINKGVSPAQFISPDGKYMLITNITYEDSKIKNISSELIKIDELNK